MAFSIYSSRSPIFEPTAIYAMCLVLNTFNDTVSNFDGIGASGLQISSVTDFMSLKVKRSFLES